LKRLPRDSQDQTAGLWQLSVEDREYSTAA
jgi:hypothetical protein